MGRRDSLRTARIDQAWVQPAHPLENRREGLAEVRLYPVGTSAQGGKAFSHRQCRGGNEFVSSAR